MADVTLAIIETAFIGIAGVFTYVAFTQQRKRMLLRASGVAASGVVVRLEKDSDPDSSSLYPVVQYTTSSHETITVRHNFGTYPASFHLGQQVSLLYNPANPQEFIIGKGLIDWDALGFGLFGVAGLGYGLFEVIKVLRS